MRTGMGFLRKSAHLHQLGMRGGGYEYFWTRGTSRIDAGDAAVVHHQDTIAAAPQLREFRTHQQDPLTVRGEVIDEPVYVPLSAHIDASGWIVQEKDVRVWQEAPGQQRFLLIPAT